MALRIIRFYARLIGPFIGTQLLVLNHIIGSAPFTERQLIDALLPDPSNEQLMVLYGRYTIFTDTHHIDRLDESQNADSIRNTLKLFVKQRLIVVIDQQQSSSGRIPIRYAINSEMDESVVADHLAKLGRIIETL